MSDTRIDEIRKELKNYKLVVFVGAGASKNYHIPDWHTLIDKFAKKLNYKSKKIINEKNKTTEYYSSDEYLLIPQYFKEEFEEEEYWEFLNNALKPDELNKEEIVEIYKPLFKLKPQHIITTNFDDLLEKENEKQIVKYDVIKTDIDLAKSTENSYIIKMHGDLREKNIVLTENDYLSYSNNFKLIENFVKSLFATHTVLFIGFSFTDPNFKKIYHWVQDILQGDTRNAYFFYTDSLPLPSYENQYFSSKKVNIITSSDILPIEMQNLLQGQKLFNMLEKIDKGTFIEELYERLLQFSFLNYIFVEDVKNILMDFPFKISMNHTDRFVVLDEDIVTEILNKNYDIKKFEFVKNSLAKASFDGFYRISSKGKLSNNYVRFAEFQSIEYKDDFFDLFTDFNYEQLNKKLESFNPKSISENLKKAFYYHKLGQNQEALKIYSELLIKSENDSYYLKIILMLNKKIILEILKFECYRNNFYWEESEKINIDKFIRSIKNPEKATAMEFLSIIRNNYDRLYKKISLNRAKLEKDKRVLENRGSVINSNATILFELCDKLFIYIHFNYLPIDFYSNVSNIFYHYFDTVMLSYTTKCTDDVSSFGFPSSTISALHYNPLYIAIYYLSLSELKDIFLKYKPDFPLQLHEINLDDLVKYLGNLIDYIEHYKHDAEVKYNHSFEKLTNQAMNFSFLLSYCDLESHHYNSLFDYMNRLNKKLSMQEIKEYIINVLQNIEKKLPFTFENYEELLNDFTLKLHYTILSDNSTDFGKIFSLIEKIFPTYKIKDIEFLKGIYRNAEEPNFSKVIRAISEGYGALPESGRKEFNEILLSDSMNNPSEWNIWALYNVIEKDTSFDKTQVDILKLSNGYKKYILSQQDYNNSETVLTFDFLYSVLHLLKIDITELELNDIENLIPFYDCFLFRKPIDFDDFTSTWLLHLLNFDNPKEELITFLSEQKFKFSDVKDDVLEKMETDTEHCKQYIQLFQFIQNIEKERK